MKQCNKLKILCFLLFISLLCCGCEKEAPSTENISIEDTDISTDASTVTPSPIDENTTITTPTFVMTDTPLMVKEYLPIKLIDEPEAYASKVLHADSFGSKLYMLADYLYASNHHALRFYIFDMDTKELIPSEFIMNNSDWSYFTINSMDIVDENTLSFRLSCHMKETNEYTEILYQTDLHGTCLNYTQSFPNEDTYPWNSKFGSLRTFAFSDGSTYLTEWNNADSISTITTYDKETNAQTTIVDIPNDFISSLTKDSENNLYYIGNGYITLYHPKEKTGIRICSLTDCGISSYENLHLLINDTKELSVVSQNTENPGIYFLAPKDKSAATNNESIRLTRLVPYGMDYVSQKAATLSNTSSIKIDIEKLDDSLYSDTQAQEAFHDRIMMEITVGDGPELLWVSHEDMKLLAEKGALMDLETLLPQEVMDQMLPGVLDLRVNGVLVGTTPEVSFHTMLASNKWWSEDNWTTLDFLNIAESKTDWVEPVLYARQNINYYFWLYNVLLQRYDAFIDFESKTCSFDSETFLRMLELCKKYGAPNHLDKDGDEICKMLAEGESFAMVKYFYDGFRSFSEFMTEQGSYAHIVGYPTSQGSEHYLYSEGYLVVNANATHIEEIKELLAHLFSYENQYTISGTPVRKDVLRDRVVKNPYSGEYRILLNMDASLEATIDTKPDGSPWIEEFMVFAESAVPEPYSPSAVNTILGDELPSYFNGDKSAEDTIDIIQNRVQLYLDEMQ